MIATVRIAPVERWCEEGQRAGIFKPGQTIEILTETMERRLGRPYREWIVSEESKKAIVEAGAGRYHGNGHWWICEHMLEMD